MWRSTFFVTIFTKFYRHTLRILFQQIYLACRNFVRCRFCASTPLDDVVSAFHSRPVSHDAGGRATYVKLKRTFSKHSAADKQMSGARASVLTLPRSKVKAVASLSSEASGREGSPCSGSSRKPSWKIGCSAAFGFVWRYSHTVHKGINKFPPPPDVDSNSHEFFKFREKKNTKNDPATGLCKPAWRCYIIETSNETTCGNKVIHARFTMITTVSVAVV